MDNVTAITIYGLVILAAAFLTLLKRAIDADEKINKKINYSLDDSV